MQFIQGNSNLSLTLSGTNGLTLTGGLAKVLSLPTDSILHLDGIYLDTASTALTGQLVFPQGAGGSSAPGIRFTGGTTIGGLAMNDGILEFWNNFSEYCTPVSGHLQGIFRYDTRSGYEVEGFTIGGKLLDGTGFNAIGVDFNDGDINMAYYGYGAIALGTDTGTAGISGLNGCVAIKYDLYMGRDIIVNSSGMKIGTATSQPLSFWNATPIVQPTTAIGASTFATNTSGIADDTATWDGYTVGQVVQALRNVGLLA